MTVSATLSGVFLKGVAASRPAANAVAGGTVYSATDTGVISQSDGSSWSTWATISSGLADPMTTRGDIIARLSGGTGRLALGAAGKVLRSDGTDILYAYPPGYEFSYDELTAATTSITHTTEGTADTVIAGSAVSYDGSTAVLIDVYLALVNPSGSASLVIVLTDGGSAIGELGTYNTSAGIYAPFRAARRLTPSNASHTYGVKAYTGSGTGTVFAGSGGAGTKIPGFIRVTKV